jgi:predicted enzyme involved in methoxymalonyl-ACP biosynthesis
MTLYFTLQDKFGDHGLISVVILQKQADKVLFVNTWLMMRGCGHNRISGMAEAILQHY